MKKRHIIIALLFLSLIYGVALSATNKLEISSEQKLNVQFKAFRHYLDNLPAEQRQAWLEELQYIISEASHNPQETADTSSETMVWIPKSGKKYHSTSSCSNMKNPSCVTLSEAKSRGFTPCKKCSPPK
ncbi:MAG TPA: hypothetical protein GXZ91_08220 [Christensenellaceae bacterium]|jgi:hypothetical protein|nr:hypothetical protein [Christensenellaceae bacterium]